MGIDATRLAEARAILEEQLRQTDFPAHRRKLQAAIHYIDQVSRPDTSGNRIPEAIWVEMFKTGADSWIAGLLGIETRLVCLRRARLGMEPRPRGGCPVERRREGAAWTNHWRPKLAQLGIIKTA